MIYIDNLTLIVVIKLLKLGAQKVIIINDIKINDKIYSLILRSIGFDVVFANYFVGHLRTGEGEHVWTASRRNAGLIALNASKEIVQKKQILLFNRDLGNNTVRLVIAKRLFTYIEYWTTRVLVSGALAQNEVMEVWLKKPLLINENHLRYAFPSIQINLYSSLLIFKYIKNTVSVIALTIRSLGSMIKWNYGFKKSSKICEYSYEDPAVLSLQEDSIRIDSTLRNQLYWYSGNNKKIIFNYYIIKSTGSIYDEVPFEKYLSSIGVRLFPYSIIGTALKKTRKDTRLATIKKNIKYAYRSILLSLNDLSVSYFVIIITDLLSESLRLGALALYTNTKIFLIKEAYYSSADAIQLVSRDIGVTTIACQYSNLGGISPLMMSTADKMLLFSNMYKYLYVYDGIRPGELLSTGYLYDFIGEKVAVRSKNNRAKLKAEGAKFIVTYFDESVSHDRGGMISKSDHLTELHILAKTVLEDKTFGVVIKSQFMKNSPSQLYPDDLLIKDAKNTGRFLELMEGFHRNDIYPAEAALISDLCIGHKVGATAAIEAACFGVRTVLLDSGSINCFWDYLTKANDIEYNKLDELMNAIYEYRNSDDKHRALGDWSSIISQFISFHDGKAVDRLVACINESI